MKQVDVVERSLRNTLLFLLKSCNWRIFVKENSDRKRSMLSHCIYVNLLFSVVEASCIVFGISTSFWRPVADISKIRVSEFFICSSNDFLTMLEYPVSRNDSSTLTLLSILSVLHWQFLITYIFSYFKVLIMFHHGSVGRVHSKKMLLHIYTYFLGIVLLFFIKRFVFLSF